VTFRTQKQVTRVHHLLAHALVDQPEALAVVQDGRGWSYAQLAAECARIADWLASRGVGRADRVMTVLPGSVHLVALLYACSSLGAILVPVPPNTAAFQLNVLVADVEPSVVVVARPETVGSVLARGLVLDLSMLIAGLPRAGADAGLEHLGKQCDGRMIAFLLYTSGSTSMPKAVICPHDRVLFATRAIASRLRYRHGDVVYSMMPLSFDYGLYQVLLCAQAMCTLVLDESTSALRIVSVMREVGATVVPLVPSLAAVLGPLAMRTTARPPVRLLTSTGAPLSAAAAATLRSAFPAARLSVMYGLTECKRATIMPADGDLMRSGSVGIPLQGTRVHVLVRGELTREPGVTGEVVIEGPHVMAGYWRAAELTARKFLSTADGRRLLMTGDAGYLDADGYLYLTGRLDDTFKRHGVRMSCQEIEFAALDIPGVREAVVLPPFGEQDLAIVVSGQLQPASVQHSLAERLPPEKCPAHCDVVPELPVTSHGKVDRQFLRRRLEHVAGRSVY
jgi:acyl-CoA synthetase (AMP-forming)/AMP-acid ligase II